MPEIVPIGAAYCKPSSRTRRDLRSDQKTAAELAVKGVFIGTSNWKYEAGWTNFTHRALRVSRESRHEAIRAGLPRRICGGVQDGCAWTRLTTHFPQVEYLQALADQVPRLPLKPGRKYAEAVKTFPPCNKAKSPTRGQRASR